jgi:hypothetical protein
MKDSRDNFRAEVTEKAFSIIQGLQAEAWRLACEYWKDNFADNPEEADLPDMSNDLDYSGELTELIDSSVPIYYSEQADLFWAFGDEIEEAFENHFGAEAKSQNWPMGWQAAAIFCWLSDRLFGLCDQSWLELSLELWQCSKKLEV